MSSRLGEVREMAERQARETAEAMRRTFEQPGGPRDIAQAERARLQQQVAKGMEFLLSQQRRGAYPEKPQPGPQEPRAAHLREAVEHLRQAAEHAKAAGFGEAGEQFARQAKRLEEAQRTERPPQPKAGGEDLQRQLDDLRQEIRRLRQEVKQPAPGGR
jgi:hypothetical protein